MLTDRMKAALHLLANVRSAGHTVSISDDRTCVVVVPVLGCPTMTLLGLLEHYQQELVAILAAEADGAPQSGDLIRDITPESLNPFWRGAWEEDVINRVRAGQHLEYAEAEALAVVVAEMSKA